MACAGRGGTHSHKDPPPPPPPPIGILDRFWQPRQKSRMASILETVSMEADFGHQQWSCTNFQLSDRTLRSRDRIFEFHRNWWKFAWPPRIWTPLFILACRAGTTSWCSTGKTPPIKAERLELWSHLGSTCLRGNTSTRIWTRALQPDQEEVGSWRFRQAQILSGCQTFPLIFLLGAEILTPAKILSYAYIFARRLYFVYPPKFP